MKNPFENALSQIDRAVAVQGFDDDFLARLRDAEREVRISIPVLMDSGHTKMFEGYRVQHNSARGPYKGGIRFHPQTEINEVRALALWMTMKTAVVNLPMGGGKGGVTVDSKTLSVGELERLSRGWVRMLAPIIGPHSDVPAPDVNTTPQIMAWMVDEYEKIKGDKTRATFTGKPLNCGGSEGRGEATGRGGWFVFDVLRKFVGLEKKCDIVVQGMGNVGGNAARIFRDNGARIIAMSDSRGGVYDAGGLDPAAVEAYKKGRGSLDGFPARTISNAELLELECDVLVPAALENQITAENAHRIKARMVLELANGPTTPEADDILLAKGIMVVPDILANAGGVAVSTFEWEQNLKNERWGEKEVVEKLRTQLSPEALNVHARADLLHTDLRRAAFIVALERIRKAIK